MNYTAILEPEADGRYSVHIPSLPCVHSSGASRAEALERVREAAELWIEVEREHGRAIPADEPLLVVASVSRLILEQQTDGLNPALELIPIVLPAAVAVAA